MIKQNTKQNDSSKGETWICLLGANRAMHAEDIEEKPDGSVSFICLVEYKDGRHRKERITTRKEHIVYISETLEKADSK
jgi:hypothetical protein